MNKEERIQKWNSWKSLAKTLPKQFKIHIESGPVVMESYLLEYREDREPLVRGGAYVHRQFDWFVAEKMEWDFRGYPA